MGQVFIVFCLALLLSGSLIPLQDQKTSDSSAYSVDQIAGLVAEVEADVQLYQEDLQQAGQELLEEQVGQLRRAQAQQLLDASKALQAEIEQEGQAIQAQLGTEILRLQLQLVLVSLDGEQQLKILQRITQLQDELEQWERQAQVDFEARFTQLKSDSELAGEQELRQLQAKLEQVMTEDMADYSQARYLELERDLALVTPFSRSVSQNRAY